jgi:hypothetical protein
MTLTPTFLQFFHDVMIEVDQADKKHGDWSDKNSIFCAEKIADEANEVQSAAAIGDIDGEHGIKREAIQVATTAYKIYRKHSQIVCNERGI